MFFATWPDRRSLLIDTQSEATARKIATETGDGAPEAVTPVPADVLTWEVFDDEDADEDDFVTVEPMPHTLEVLDALEDASNGDTDAPAERCTSVAVNDEEEEVTCELEAHGAETKHRFKGLVWR